MNFEDIQEATGYEQGLAAEYARQENQAILEELERKKRARSIAVPTDDGRVRKRLRDLGEPITLFGERAADRRARLIHLISKRDDYETQEAMEVDSDDSEEVRSLSSQAFDLILWVRPRNSILWVLKSWQRPDDGLQSIRFHGKYLLSRDAVNTDYSRARSRVMRQKQEAKLPLTRVIEMRRQFFGSLKVCVPCDDELNLRQL